MNEQGQIRVGIAEWRYDAWRSSFYAKRTGASCVRDAPVDITEETRTAWTASP
jgi:hypothetical protein